jgi:hypothetical protein
LRTSIVPGGALAGPWVRDPLWRNARAVPSIDLRLADNKSLFDSVTGQNLITFTRASTATYVDSNGLVQTATSNAARFDHGPVTGASLGLLVEEARTNALTGSQDFSNTYWNASNAVRTNNSGTAPNGTNTACLVAGGGVAFNGIVRKNAASVYAINTTYSISCFAKAGTYNYIGIRPTSSCVAADGVTYCSFNLTTGVATPITANAGTVVSVSMQPFPNGWYRCTVIYTTSAAQSGSDIVDVALVTSTGSHGYAGTGNVLIWGAQMETGSFPTSYIPTVASTVTRAADVASLTGTNFSSWFNASAGTTYFQGRSTSSAAVYWSFDDSTSSNRITTNASSGGATSTFSVSVSGTDSCSIASASFTLGSTFAQATAYALNDFANTVNGGTVGTDTLGPLPVVNKATLGSRVSAYQNGTIARFTYWPTRLSNVALQTVTAP